MNPPLSQTSSLFAYLKELEDLKRENNRLKESISASTRSRSNDSKFTDGNLESVNSAGELAIKRGLIVNTTDA